MATLTRDTAKKLDAFLDVYYHTNFNDKMLLNKELIIRDDLSVFGAFNLSGALALKDGSTVTLGSATGVKIGATGDKVGFLGATPIVRQAAITTPLTPSAAYSQAEAASAKAAIDAIRAYLTAFGFTL